MPASAEIRTFQAERVPKPYSPSSQLLGCSPLDIEIGAGNGRFAQAYARQFPNRHLIAIERTKTRTERFKNRMIDQAALKNLDLIRDNAINWITHHVMPNTVDRYFILYPNPYPKKEHQNKRWPWMPFMGFLVRTLKKGGEITLATNKAFYYEEAKRCMTQNWDLKTVTDMQFQTEPQHRPTTQFEIKFLGLGETCFEVCWQKT